MIEIQIKRIYEKPDISEGYRILVDRLWPRGIKKDEAILDELTKDIAPSSALRNGLTIKKIYLLNLQHGTQRNCNCMLRI